MSKHTVCITGANGRLGRELVECLCNLGHSVVGLVRSEAGAQVVRDAGAEAVIAQLSDTDTLDIQALTLNADLIVNGEAGLDDVTITGDMNLAGHFLSINAERITVNSGVTVAAGDITLDATAVLGTVVTPDTLPLANIEAAININNASLSGDNVSLSADAALVSNVTNLPGLPAASLLANISSKSEIR